MQNSQSPMDAEGGAVMFSIWLSGLIQNRPLSKAN